ASAAPPSICALDRIASRSLAISAPLAAIGAKPATAYPSSCPSLLPFSLHANRKPVSPPRPIRAAPAPKINPCGLACLLPFAFCLFTFYFLLFPWILYRNP
ncbi:MAG: hypothetical protein ACRD6I_17390, partial [Candidatus Acidiferrales bacterium]